MLRRLTCVAFAVFGLFCFTGCGVVGLGLTAAGTGLFYTGAGAFYTAAGTGIGAAGISRTQILDVESSESGIEKAEVLNVPVLPPVNEKPLVRDLSWLTLLRVRDLEESESNRGRTGLLGPDIPALLITMCGVDRREGEKTEMGLLQSWLVSIFVMERGGGEELQWAVLQLPLVALATGLKDHSSLFSYKSDDEDREIGLLWFLDFKTSK